MGEHPKRRKDKISIIHVVYMKKERSILFILKMVRDKEIVWK